MARKGEIEIPIAVDTGGIAKEINNGLVDPIEDAEAALKKLGDTDAGRDIDRDLKKAQDATEDLDDKLDETRKSLDKLGYAAKDAGSDGKAGLDKIKGGAQEVQNEIGSNMGEAFSSFRGDIEDIGQIGQDTLGGLAATAAGIGGGIGLGAAAGLGAVAAGVGIVTEAFTKAEEAAEEARDAAFAFAYDVSGALEAAGYAERLASWTQETENWKKAQDIAAVSSWDVVDVVDALASGGDKLDSLWDAFETGAATTTVATNRALELESSLKGVREGYAGGAAAAEINSRALGEYAKSVGTATGETDDLGNAIYSLPGGKEIVVNAKTGKAYEDIDALEKKNVADKTIKVAADRSGFDNALTAIQRANYNVVVGIQGRAGKAVPF